MDKRPLNEWFFYILSNLKAINKQGYYMAEPAEVFHLSEANDSEAKKNDERQISEKIKDRRSQELIIGLCGAVGSGVKKLKESVISELKAVGYKVCHIRLSHLIADTQGDKAKEIKELTGFERYKRLQDLGDELRNSAPNNLTVVAEMAIREIVTLRNAEFKDETTRGGLAKTKKKVAYVIDQIKNPAEVDLLKTVYRNNFYLIGLLRNKEERIQNLRDEPMTNEQANILIERDRSSKDSDGKTVGSGQQVEKTLYLADYFIKNIDQMVDINVSVGRFLKLIHGVGNLTPTHDETGIFTAHSASFRSACLSRQVGSCIMDDEGNILATGCNDVPKAGGGLYNSNTNIDMRCYNRATCFNDKHKDILSKEIEVLLNKLNVKSPALIAEKIMDETKAKSIIEYSRAIHAEMDSIMALARNTSISSVGKVMYCTTFPCHNCARHIVAAGIKRVIYIEPYEKSLALDLHSDAITQSDSAENTSKVVFSNFEGVSPARYESFFKINRVRKEEGRSKNYEITNSPHVDPIYLDSYISYETRISKEVTSKLGKQSIPDFDNQD